MKNNLTQKKNEELCAHDYTYMHIIADWQWHSNTSISNGIIVLTVNGLLAKAHKY